MLDHDQAARDLRDSLRANLIANAKQATAAQPSRAAWEAAGLDFEDYRKLGDRQILLDYLLACHEIDPLDALHEVVTLPTAEAKIRRRAALAEIQLRSGHWSKSRRIRSAA
ncbi:MAG: hypothetical protein ACTSX7_11600 [Alphaproteobacteria bacterium]